MDDTAVLVPGAHRGIRLVDARESAVPGELITDGDALRVRVDAAAVPDALWRFAGAEHVAGVCDVVRRRDGHDALLPWCTERVEVFLGKRMAADAALAPGETVTLVGSLLRGVVEVGEDQATGQWWLTDEMRPVFVPGEGAACEVAARAVVGRLRDSCADRALQRTLAEIDAGLADRRVVAGRADGWERELTELASPRALRREAQLDGPAAMRPRRARELSMAVPAAAGPVSDTGLPVTERRGAVQGRMLEGVRLVIRSAGDAARGSLAVLRGSLQGVLPAARARIARGVDIHPGLHERTGAPAGGRRRRGRAASTQQRSPRRRMLLVGAAVAGLVLAGGMLWPESDAGSAANGARAADAQRPAADDDERGAEAGTADAGAGTAAPVDAGSSAGGAPADRLEQQGAALLERIASCTADGDQNCAAAIAAGSASLVQERLRGAAGSRAVTLVDDYGDVAVLRLGASGDRGEQMLVLVGQEDGWLVRDVYDVADQPSGQG
ncbi:hypothetical protein [Microbacterium sp. USHLN186]|uniref:hypothetical protein n=1 Tax=Microbacterium sp. USHLN186 TaxID=3081286 RepID=UPI003015EFB8